MRPWVWKGICAGVASTFRAFITTSGFKVLVQWWAMKSQPRFAFGSTAVYLNFWQPSPWAKVFIGLFVWYWPDPQQLESAVVISHHFSETQGAVLICPSWRSGPQYERDHIIREAASPGSKAAEPSSLPCGFAAQGVDILKGGEEGKIPLSCSWLLPAPHLGMEINPCVGSFRTLKRQSLHWIMLCIFPRYSTQRV